MLPNFYKTIVFLFFLTFSFAAYGAQPWIDLPEDDYSKLACFEDDHFDTLNHLVEHYHGIPKSIEAELKNRILALQNISDFITAWIDKEPVGYRRSFLKNIKGLAEGKKWYLSEIVKRREAGQFEAAFLKAYHADLEGMDSEFEPIYLIHERHYDSRNGMYFGEFWYETIDPCHRQLTPNYDLWLKQGGNKEDIFSFFLWLEDQNLSRDIPTIEFLDEQQLSQCIVIVENGLLYLPLSDQKTLVDFDKEGEEYIFGIDLSEHLLLKPASKTIHHVSFSHGKAVLGAGNMTVKKGNIKSIELESGHYMPSKAQGVQILRILQKNGVIIDSEVPFTNYDNTGKHKVTVGEMLEGTK